MDRKLTLVGHLSELRKRIIVSLLAIGIATIVSFPFASKALAILKLPAASLIGKLVFFSPPEAFLIYMRIAVTCGLVFSMPVILYQIWAFVRPALKERFRRQGAGFILFCLASFIAGCLFSYFVLLPPTLKFLLGFATEDLGPVISASKYISFVIGLILGCGLVFQMPVLSLILTKVEILNSGILRKKYKYAVLVIFVAAAIITPTADAFNMLVLAAPMLVLYEISIWVSFLAGPKNR